MPGVEICMQIQIFIEKNFLQTQQNSQMSGNFNYYNIYIMLVFYFAYWVQLPCMLGCNMAALDVHTWREN